MQTKMAEPNFPPRGQKSVLKYFLSKKLKRAIQISTFWIPGFMHVYTTSKKCSDHYFKRNINIREIMEADITENCTCIALQY